jgi:plasmid maintenance system antidote protein VapI
MKSEEIDKKYSKEEQVESFVFRIKRSDKQIQEASNELVIARKKARGKLNESQILYAKVQQLRFLIEDYAKSNTYNKDFSFAYFLRKYIRLNYKLNKNFAADIELPQTELSSILNKGRIPSKKTIVRLELHSSNTISAVSWYKLLEKQKEYDLQTDKEARLKESKHVKNRLVFDF